jgi:hypothetical protein
MTLKSMTTVPENQPQINMNAHNEEADILAQTTAAVTDEIAQEETVIARQLEEANKKQIATSGKNIAELTEEDAYDFEVPIHAGAAHNPNILKVVLKDKNYVCRWGNTNTIRMTMLRAQGFVPITLSEVENTDTLEMFEDAQNHLVYADLIAMKIPKNIYYAALRRNHQKSMYMTNDKKATEAGANFAKNNLMGELKGNERAYIAQQEETGKKPIYSPKIGV